MTHFFLKNNVLAKAIENAKADTNNRNGRVEIPKNKGNIRDNSTKAMQPRYKWVHYAYSIKNMTVKPKNTQDSMLNGITTEKRSRRPSGQLEHKQHLDRNCLYPDAAHMQQLKEKTSDATQYRGPLRFDFF